MSRDLIFIRTHHFGEIEARLAGQLARTFGRENVVICVDESRGTVDTGSWPKSSLTTARAESLNGGPVPADWGWRMGDLCHVAVQEDFGPRPHQWLIENDVHIPDGQEDVIFGRLQAMEADFLACDLRIKKVKPIAAAVALVLPVAEWGCIFAFNRLAGRRVTDLHAARRAISQQLSGHKLQMPNDEAVLSNLAVSAGWQVVNLFDAAPDIFSRHWFDTNPPMLREALDAAGSGPRVSHPALSYGQLLGRLSQNGTDGHPQKYKTGRLSRIIAALAEDQRDVVRAMVVLNDT